jgi:transporter family-2 protein
MPSFLLLPLALVLAGGVAFATQAPINAALSRTLGNGVAAATVSFGVGFVALLAVMLAMAGPGALIGLSKAPTWQLVGGLLGAFTVFATLTAVSALGVVTTFAALVLGQLLAAAALDVLGAFNLPVHALTWQRVLAVAMVAGGLVLSRL